jgi:hypothetical protein
MYSAGDDPKGPGFPIRKSTDQRVLAPPRSLSQRATSFVASVRQGIHQMPLKRLIQRNPSRPGINLETLPAAKSHPPDALQSKASKGASLRNDKVSNQPQTQLIRLRFQDPARALRNLPQARPAIAKPPREAKSLSPHNSDPQSQTAKRTPGPKPGARILDFQG